MLSHEAVAEMWLERVLRSYPLETAQFLAAERDPFRNPAGHTLRQALRVLAGELLHEMDPQRITAALDSVMQIRAIQDGPPSRALEFLFQLRDIVRREWPEASQGRLEARIDGLALEAFDLFVQYRERTYQARANEARRRLYVLERRLNPGDSAAWRERGDD